MEEKELKELIRLLNKLQKKSNGLFDDCTIWRVINYAQLNYDY